MIIWRNLDPKLMTASSPRGHLVTIWDAKTGACLHHFKAVDASGVAAADGIGAFLVAGGDGVIRRVDTLTREEKAFSAAEAPVRWDNHISRSALT